ncbi:DNA-binding XRE family transcriptional regulator [Arcanobacterium pluranimalium]|uniref:helix-turn-helix domain-containing protein n=1 Tax=Arcanobacterium pluranimalium TaxID=108028 RepID=UPI00195D3EC7|nr:helix-turn-helix transcriptional regulator [Arcanobacterium pluranimalium]MBM7824386.1 DNA-binding XRE family transcriptional regulator [Arcanobacterium pluranimalium]
MAMTLEQFLEAHPVDRTEVDKYKEQMLTEVRAYRLRELRKSLGITQQQLAQRIGVSQRQVSKIEQGDIENAKLSTIRGYLNAIGGTLSLEFERGDARIRIA